jgi:methylthioribose-1-phosphate isomerase
VAWMGDRIEVIDQTELPGREVVRSLSSVAEVVEAIRALRVRGAPLIGGCGALGLALALVNGEVPLDVPDEVFQQRLGAIAGTLISARPTAVNLAWAVEHVRRAVVEALPEERRKVAERSALGVIEADRRSCAAMAAFGADYLAGVRRVLTHCNTGRLATCGVGTALGVVLELHARGGLDEVIACEARPLLQGARLTAWELAEAGVPARLIVDSAGAWALRQGLADAVLVGADRIAANGDTANKIGTLSLALAAKAHGVPFVVVAPLSTFDLSLASGRDIPVEERRADEVLGLGDRRIAAEGVDAWNPAFDVTPVELISAFVTDLGVLVPPLERALGQIRVAEAPSMATSAGGPTT